MTLNRRTFVTSAVGIAAASTAGLAGCMGTASATTGTLSTRVSDNPGDISDFESCFVTISTIRVQPTDGDEKSMDAGDTEVDLVELQGDASALVDDFEVETGTYEYLQVDVGETDATLTDGSEATVEVPGSAPLKFDTSFEIRADQTTTFTADFTPVKAGNSGKYVLQPVADEVTVVYESDETTTATNTTTSE
ncbi:DUF4382 domain-containing protein [Haloferax larsenii]|uniref:DUF4382 domain-containing protein n=1 Tax=Haloferax larsenii TaxID=302484 RepID=A0ABY5RFS1_HALLR|nr:DUF4382 domain-containing protein [Haloferax larsenii]ELZ78431.1 hypothetical protein C455_12128 [Haloferax larsenii JCM 13917]UVE50288.1 DUF4382 domain-containing protein [Haloferax larsenii]